MNLVFAALAGRSFFRPGAKLNRRVGRLLGTLAGNDFRGDKQTRLQSSSKNGDH